ncbi:hypothetical protein PIB30_100872, partial [Stylosanthes scabra]|nr:hypothetical protein [Stylosanthes scabra]
DDSVVTIFVDNLPPNTTIDWLWHIFKLEGRVMDAFLSRKKRSSNPSLFGFVRFANRVEAQRAIKKRNGWVVWGYRIKLSEARYDKNHRQVNNSKKETLPEDKRSELKQDNDKERYEARVEEGRSFREAVVNGKEDRTVLNLRDCNVVDTLGNAALILTLDENMRGK